MKPAEALDHYCALILRWAPRLDLLSTRDSAPERVARRHIQDSLSALALARRLEPGSLAVDVGSGAGLPGIPLAISSPGVRWRLVEPRRRRAAFLEEAVRELRLEAEVIVAAAEQLASDPAFAGRHALATARALAAPTRSFALLKPLVAPGGTAAVWFGERARLPAEAAVLVPGVATIGLPAPP